MRAQTWRNADQISDDFLQKTQSQQALDAREETAEDEGIAGFRRYEKAYMGADGMNGWFSQGVAASDPLPATLRLLMPGWGRSVVPGQPQHAGEGKSPEDLRAKRPTLHSMIGNEHLYREGMLPKEKPNLQLANVYEVASYGSTRVLLVSIPSLFATPPSLPSLSRSLGDRSWR